MNIELESNNALCCFMKSLRESHSVVMFQLVCDNPRSLLCPPPPAETTPKSAHKLQQWDGSSSISSPTAFYSPKTVGQIDTRKGCDNLSSSEVYQAQQGSSPRASMEDPIRRKPLQGNEQTKSLSLPDPATTSNTTTTSLPDKKIQRRWFRRSPSFTTIIGAVSIPILPVRKPSLQNLFGDKKIQRPWFRRSPSFTAIGAVSIPILPVPVRKPSLQNLFGDKKIQRPWFRRSPSFIAIGAVSIPILPVRKPCLQNLFGDTSTTR
jgi:hypothetical protein